MTKKYDVSYTDRKAGGRYRRGLNLSKKGARIEISRLKSSKIFRSLNLSNPRMYKRK